MSTEDPRPPALRPLPWGSVDGSVWVSQVPWRPPPRSATDPETAQRKDGVLSLVLWRHGRDLAGSVDSCALSSWGVAGKARTPWSPGVHEGAEAEGLPPGSRPVRYGVAGAGVGTPYLRGAALYSASESSIRISEH